tara:strand:- start:1906 stop:2295 length:390 start_codon:yes stop_codon:yes gene_type:complete
MDLKNNQKNQIGIKKYILEKKNDSSSSLCSMDSGMDSVDSRAYSIDSFNSTFHERSLSIDSQELNNVIFINESKKTNMHIQDDKNIVNKNIFNTKKKRRSRDKPIGRYSIIKSPTLESIQKILNTNTYE